MKILIISELFPPDVKGGYELRCEEACNWLHQKGYQLEVLTTRSECDENTHPYPIYRRFRKYPNGKTPSEWFSWEKIKYALLDNYCYSRTLSQVKPDLIYIWKCSEISRSLIPIIFQTSIPKLVDISSKWFHKVATQHGRIYRLLETRNESIKKNFIKKCISSVLFAISFGNIPREYRFDWITLEGYFTSHWNKNFHTKYILECEQFPVFHTGVNLTSFPFKLKENLSNKIKLLFVGRISEDKGFLLLLRQLAYLESIGVQLTVIGSFPTKSEKERIVTTVQNKGLESKVVFLGQKERNLISKYYHQADFTIFPSIWDEPFSRVPLESMSCGTPCISTDNPGSKELFDLNAPIIILERSQKGLENSIAPYIHNADKFKKISLDGRKFIEKSFTFNRFMDNIQKSFLLSKMDKSL